MTTKPDYESLFRASPYPSLVLDTTLTILDANHAYLKVVDRPAQELLGRSHFDAFPDNPTDSSSTTNSKQVKSSMERAIASGKPDITPVLRYAIPVGGSDTAEFVDRYWNAVHTPVFGDNGKVAIVVHNPIDVTSLYIFNRNSKADPEGSYGDEESNENALSRAQLHEAMTRVLKDERSHLRNLFNQSPGFVAVTMGPNHVFEMVNNAYEKLVGRCELLGKSALEAIPELFDQRLKAGLDSAYETGRPWVGHGIKVDIRSKDDGNVVEHYIDLLYQPFYSPDNKVVGVFAQGHDVTEAYKASIALQDADRRKDEFLAMLAHELRNPLAPIGAAAELLQRVKLDEDRVKKTSAVIGRQVKHMTGLIDDMLDVSRVTRGLIELESGVVDIHQVVSEAVEQVSPLIRSRRHELTLRLASQTALVQGDKKRLVQVLANILNNAAKYTAEGGHLVLCTSVEDQQVLIEVTDDGIGMTPQTVTHAFDLFAQAERSSDRSSGGLGLGLALVKSLVGLHSGDVTCKSKGLGQGSTFSIYLPRLGKSEQAALSTGSENVTQPVSAASLKILVVDDNIDAAEMLKLLLEAMGHEVLVEYGALRALEQAKRYTPQVCLIDIGLPEIDGNEVARRLRKQSENATAVLIAVTGYGHDSDRVSSLAAGFDHHLVKPVDTSALTSVLSEIGKH
jgi:PAS domain S-box-containing protein